MRLYVEAVIEADIDAVWRLTQDPALHQRWDARFGRIEYLPREDGEPQRFRYSTAVAPGVRVHGVGTSVGERWRGDGSCTSALRFGSDHPLSPIRVGEGYWRYQPVAGGVRFLTGYDYRTRWGRFGPVADAVFRPAMGWATAWSFDRLRLWAERGIEPERARRRALMDAALRVAGVAVAVGRRRPVLAAAALVAAVVVPPSPGTPSARRCLRRPPDRLAATPPRTLTALERPLVAPDPEVPRGRPSSPKTPRWRSVADAAGMTGTHVGVPRGLTRIVGGGWGGDGV